MPRTHAPEVDVGGRRLRLSNLDKVFYPEAGFTKGAVVDYYARVAPALLPHLRDRPLTVKRYPNGVDGGFFYQKQCPRPRPDWIRTATPFGEGTEYLVVDDLPTLVWAANLADLELHTPLSRAGAFERPTTVAFDLDPGAPATVVDCARVALVLRDLFERLGLRAWPKTSGSKGLQVYLPVNTAASYAETKTFARAVAQTLERRLPELVLSNMTRSLRAGKVLVDWSQNDANKTTVCAYSLRAQPRPTASTPLRWEEVAAGLERGSPDAFAFQAADVLDRVDRHGDLFAPVLEVRQRLPPLP